MDTSILHSRISEYKEKAKHPTSKEMILLFESWFMAIENYIADIELDNFGLQAKIRRQENTISLLMDVIIITGNADKIVNLEDQFTREAITLLLKSKDRKNHSEISTISTLLHLHSSQKFESIEQLREYATRQ
jgi:hypothetical protein